MHRKTANPAVGAGAPVAGRLFDAHAPALITLANLLLDDPEVAETVVAQALIDACEHPGALGSTHTTRQTLARTVYRHCARHREAAATPHGVSSTPAGGRRAEWVIGTLGRLAYQQRAALALSLFGHLTYSEVADLLDLPPRHTAALLRSSLVEVTQAGGATAASRGPETSPTTPGGARSGR